MEGTVNKNKLVCLEYPGVIENEKKMLQTIGGEANITEVYADPSKRLELKWRPDDKFCKPACGDRYRSHKLLLKVKQKAVPATAESEVKDTTNEVEAEVLGIAETTFRFECLADYQYVAVKHDKETGAYQSIYDDIVPGKRLISKCEWLQVKDAPLFVPSPLYSRMDRPQDYAYRDRPKERKERGLKIKDQPDSAIIVDRAQRKHFRKFHSFTKGAVPTGAYLEAEDRLLKRPNYRYDRPKLNQLQKHFEDRPIWSKTALQCVAQITPDQLKFILPLMAYYWESGPWRNMWCRFGFDPREEPSAKIYQLVDFRVRGARFNNINVKRSSTKEFHLPHRVVRSGVNPQAASIKHQHLQALNQHDEQDKNPDLKEHLWKFRRDVLPKQRQLFYSAVDIEIPEVQDIIHSNDGKELQCTERDGWLVANYADKIRAIMTTVVEELLGRHNLDIEEPDVLLSERARKRKKTKGKLGPKHQPKSSIPLTLDDQNENLQSATQIETEMDLDELNAVENIDDIIKTLHMTTKAVDPDDYTGSGSDSENSNSDSMEHVESEDLESKRVLRTRKLLETTDIDVSDNEGVDDEFEDKFTEDLYDSDADAEYDPSKDITGEG